ncbi:MAG: MlaD family protein [Cyanobacteria bacterium J06627_28]
MRARTIREGSVGLLILLGIGLFGGLVLWLRGFNPANRPYELIAEFDDTAGVQIGTPVMYRGVSVGRVMSITPKSNTVELGLEITEKELRMPNEVIVETVESGLIGEMSVEITPLAELPPNAMEINPVGKGCDAELILCDGAQLAGVAGPSYEELLRSTSELMSLYADPELIAQLKTVLSTVADTTEDAGVLATEATLLTRLARDEIAPLSGSAQSAANSAAAAAGQVQVTAQQFELTAVELNSLISENRGTLVDTLNNVQVASAQLRIAADTLSPTLQSGELVGNLERLVSNASAASEDLQAITSSLNTPTNLVLLQQTLESARDALSSAQKVMADIDEITGDPAMREQIRDLIRGLGALVSSTQSLEEEAQVAQILSPANVEAVSGWIGEDTAENAATSIPQDYAQPDDRQQNDARQNDARQNDIRQEVRSDAPVSGESAQTDPVGSQLPILVFDGDRYIIRYTGQVAEGHEANIYRESKRDSRLPLSSIKD